MVRSYNQTHEPGCSPYVRLSVEHTIDKVRMDDHEQMGHIASCTATYLAKEASGQLLTRAVDLGLGRAPIIRKFDLRQSSLYRSDSMSPSIHPGAMVPYEQLTQSPTQQIQYAPQVQGYPYPQQQGYPPQIQPTFQQHIPYGQQPSHPQMQPQSALQTQYPAQPTLVQSPPQMESEVE
ncbi:hypothetical protein BDV93DRAFT_556406 [Ceratobasidium sp. AG-I]|nr:hypothetical protein BDV93DRAFT_556406 [Ceratobasidium sp. AG-I]